MNPLDYAALPLATLILAVVFYTIFEAVKWAQKQNEKERDRIGFARKVDAHIAFNHGILLRALLEQIGHLTVNVAEAMQEAAKGKEEPDAKPQRSSAKTVLDGYTLGLFPYFKTTSARIKPVPGGSEEEETVARVIVTKGHLDLGEVANHIDKLKKRGGLALYFAEALPLIEKLLAEQGGLSDDPSDSIALMENRYRTITALAEGVLVTNGYLDDDFRKKLREGAEKSDEDDTLQKRAKALHTLLIKQFPAIEKKLNVLNAQFPPPPPPSNDASGKKGNSTEMVVAGPTSGSGLERFRIETFDFPVESFKVLSPPERDEKYWHARSLPIALILFFVGAVVFVEPIRSFLFSEDDPISCSATATKDGSPSNVQCQYTGKTLREAIKLGLDLPTGERGDAPGPSVTCDTTYNREGEVVLTKCSQTFGAGDVVLEDGRVVPVDE